MPSRISFFTCLLLSAAIGGCGDAPGADPQDKGTKVNPYVSTPATSPASAPSVDPRADAALKRMSATLAGARTFKLHSMATMEMRTAGGQLAQFSRNSTITFKRPDLLAAEVRRGSEVRQIWHQDKLFTMLDTKTGEYAVVPTSQNLEDALDELAEEYDIIIPLDDLFYSDPYKELMEDVISGTYVDQQNIDGHACDHLLFRQDNVDWQIWIDTEQMAVPRKVVITYKGDPDRPQFEAVLDQWKLNVPVEDAEFAPKLPENAKKVEVDQLLAADEEEGD